MRVNACLSSVCFADLSRRVSLPGSFLFLKRPSLDCAWGGGNPGLLNLQGGVQQRSKQKRTTLGGDQCSSETFLGIQVGGGLESINWFFLIEKCGQPCASRGEPLPSHRLRFLPPTCAHTPHALGPAIRGSPLGTHRIGLPGTHGRDSPRPAARHPPTQGWATPACTLRGKESAERLRAVAVEVPRQAVGPQVAVPHVVLHISNSAPQHGGCQP